ALMIELETMLMQFCLETSGRLDGDRYPVGKGVIDSRRSPNHSVATPLASPEHGNSSSRHTAKSDPLQRKRFGLHR
ncbi:MAG: hypothetical protein MUD04_00655, partial [Cyanobium sp. Prado107]|nr:hypothetical protein [Cyanobium sp. Prado107]